MSEAVNQELINNISFILKRSLSADATLADLRENKKAGFAAIFTEDAGFTCTANTFQPYVEELADDLLQWQQNPNKEKLVVLVKKIEQLLLVLNNFEKAYTE